MVPANACSCGWAGGTGAAIATGGAVTGGTAGQRAGALAAMIPAPVLAAGGCDGAMGAGAGTSEPFDLGATCVRSGDAMGGAAGGGTDDADADRCPAAANGEAAAGCGDAATRREAGVGANPSAEPPIRGVPVGGDEALGVKALRLKLKGCRPAAGVAKSA